MYDQGQKMFNLCLTCGLAVTALNEFGNCPPWSTTDEGETKTNRAHEAGVVKRFQIRIQLLEDLLNTATEKKMDAIPIAALQMLIQSLEQLIQKYEGLDQS